MVAQERTSARHTTVSSSVGAVAVLAAVLVAVAAPVAVAATAAATALGLGTAVAERRYGIAGSLLGTRYEHCTAWPHCVAAARHPRNLRK
jgi:hypothetical protein